MKPTPEIRISGRVESLDDKIVVKFSDGSVAVFDASFLYQHRTESPNRVLARSDPE